MSMTDPIADFLTRIRNGLHAGHDEVVIPHSKMKVELARILQEQGYIVGYSVERARVGEELHVQLKYTESRASVISGLKRVSKPGRCVYVASGDVPRVLGGMGTAVVSTSQGLMTGYDARRSGVGGGPGGGVGEADESYRPAGPSRALGRRAHHRARPRAREGPEGRASGARLARHEDHPRGGPD